MVRRVRALGSGMMSTLNWTLPLAPPQLPLEWVKAERFTIDQPIGDVSALEKV
jgi:hypothetical protein